MSIKAAFTNYLINRGYTEFSLNGTPSTVYDYVGRVERVCVDEKISLNDLPLLIDTLLPEYERTGAKHSKGRRSHESVLNAMCQFRRFVRLGMVA